MGLNKVGCLQHIPHRLQEQEQDGYILFRVLRAGTSFPRGSEALPGFQGVCSCTWAGQAKKGLRSYLGWRLLPPGLCTFSGLLSSLFSAVPSLETGIPLLKMLG